ncbi:MAG TPA: VOC family protein [Bradyrhizobium sp.]|jgi:PhnB protein|nr:VOC family protein [Bradyrhizobium sp.]
MAFGPNPPPIQAHICVKDGLEAIAYVDTAVDRARSAGAEIVMSAQDTFWGARYGRVRDPFGHVWAFNAPLKENAA